MDEVEIWSGVMIGIAYVLPPGPVNIETVRRGLTGGFRAALALQCGALIGDMTYAVLAWAGAGLLLTQTAAQSPLGIAGTALLLYLGWSAFKSWKSVAGTVIQRSGTMRVSHRQAFGAGLTISLANPFTIAFWLSLGGSVIQHSHANGLGFLTGFFSGCLLSSILIAVLAGRGMAHVAPRAVRIVSSACGLALVAFGLSLGYSTMVAWPVW